MLVGICQKYLQALIAEPLVTTVDFDGARIGPSKIDVGGGGGEGILESAYRRLGA